MVGAATSLSAPEYEGQTPGSHRDWLEAEKHRAALNRTWAEWFEQYDLLLCPVIATPPFPHVREGKIMDRTITVGGESRSLVSAVSWPGLIGVLGLPAAAVPIGRTAAGLPVGMQIVAPFLHDRRAVRAAQISTPVLGGYTTPPGF
jgi:amidase